MQRRQDEGDLFHLALDHAALVGDSHFSKQIFLAWYMCQLCIMKIYDVVFPKKTAIVNQI